MQSCCTPLQSISTTPGPQHVGHLGGGREYGLKGHHQVSGFCSPKASEQITIDEAVDQIEARISKYLR
jgi:hypothetical protein